MSIRATFHYFQGMECDMYSFYRIPKLLFTSEYFKNLSCEAKVLYGLMLDRMSLSIKKLWLTLIPNCQTRQTRSNGPVWEQTIR